MQWTEEGPFEEAWRRLIELLVRKNRIKLDESVRRQNVCFGKKGGLMVGPTRRGKTGEHSVGTFDDGRSSGQLRRYTTSGGSSRDGNATPLGTMASFNSPAS